MLLAGTLAAAALLQWQTPAMMLLLRYTALEERLICASALLGSWAVSAAVDCLPELLLAADPAPSSS
jgi:hypothetical protein